MAELSIYITLGDGALLAIDFDGSLHVVKRDLNGKIVNDINLGLATKKRFEELEEYFGRLKIHAVDSIPVRIGEALEECYPWGYHSEDKEP